MIDFYHSKKAATLTVSVVFVVSLSGFFMGLRQTVRETRLSGELSGLPLETGEARQESGAAPVAVSYSQLASAGFGPNASFRSEMSSLIPPQSETVQERPEVIAERRARRAFNGAPPVVPHPISQSYSVTCLGCHEEATRIDTVVSPGISHPVYQSCTQCHVSSEGLGTEWNTGTYRLSPFGQNRFTGHHELMPGERAYDDSPPTIPHVVHMRQNCNSCHGPLGTSPIRTTHPERKSCMQCHVPGTGVEKSFFGESPFPFRPELIK